jgi:hypothetical protein
VGAMLDFHFLPRTAHRRCAPHLQSLITFDYQFKNEGCRDLWFAAIKLGWRVYDGCNAAN